ncbi:DUF2332 domain-containing protein [Tomitella gaofuii]|uniref:DUF2332 domain-containing protein n=1 Tax=Tomitella gaofuii TaxID=2760083 RepID=UPI001F2DAAD6|nr:DUF2332 domain-containing protein [Tomitella gaofuii]
MVSLTPAEHDLVMDTARRYRLFAEYEAHGNSPVYEQWCRGIADDPALIGLIDQLPLAKRQPNLVLGAARYLGVPESSFPEFRAWLLTHWEAVGAMARTRSTQTNECGRAAVLLPILASLQEPLSLIEVGASAGLCLFPDRFSYRYTMTGQKGAVREIDPQTGRSPVVLPCTVSGNAPLPTALPEVAYRAGVDVNPLDPHSDDDMRWLEALVWPGQDERLRRLRSAAKIARNEPPRVTTGDLTDTITDLVCAAPPGTTVVVFGSAVLNYIDPAARRTFEHTVRELPCHWVSNEGAVVIEPVTTRLPKSVSETRGQFVVTLDSTPLAYAGGHGQTLDWLAS